MVNKRGFIKTLEAMIAIILLLGLIFYLISNQPREIITKPQSIVAAEEFIHTEVLEKKEIRECMIQTTENGKCQRVLSATCKEKLLDTIFESAKPFGYSFECEICTEQTSCLSQEDQEVIPDDRSVYINTIFVSGTPNKILRSYFWEE